MIFRTEEHGALVHLYPVESENWMIIHSHGDMPWKVYKKVGAGHEYIDEFLKLRDAYAFGKANYD